MAGQHPYRNLARDAYWARSVSSQFDPTALARRSDPLLRRDDQVASIGSCFASNLVPHFEAAGLTYVRTEMPHPAVSQLQENLGYRNFSAAYGNVYTARHMHQLARRCVGTFRPIEDRWYDGDAVIDPFRPGLAYPASSDAEFDTLTASHLAATRRAFEVATVVVITLGQTEAWESRLDGAVFPSCPGTVAGSFAEESHRFVNFGVAEVVDDLRGFIDIVRGLNNGARFIITVSPVPMIATASGRHVLEATTYTKSVLRVAAAELEASVPDVVYFPAYEIVTGPQAPYESFEADRRSVSPAAIQTVMDAFLAASDLPGSPDPALTAALSEQQPLSDLRELSRQIVEAACEEIYLDPAFLSIHRWLTGTRDPLVTDPAT